MEGVLTDPTGLLQAGEGSGWCYPEHVFFGKHCLSLVKGNTRNMKDPKAKEIEWK